jgi:O-antigen/teichoic acid export membrane protein
VVATVVSLWVTSIVSLSVGYDLLRRLRVPLGASRAQLREICSFVAFSSLTGIGNVLFAFVDRIAVAAVLGVSAVAYYSVATGVAINLLRVAGVITKPLMPATSSRAGASDWAAVKRLMRHATGAVGALELVGCGVLLAASGPLIRIWLGPDFGSHVLTAFRILIVVFALAAIGAPAYQIANGIGAPWVPALAGVLGGILTIVLIFVLAPVWGIAGAAAANAGGLTALFPLVYLSRRLRRGRGRAAERLAAV